MRSIRNRRRPGVGCMAAGTACRIRRRTPNMALAGVAGSLGGRGAGRPRLGDMVALWSRFLDAGFT